MKLETFHDFDFKEFTFPVITIYENPTDFPGQFVARLFDLNHVTYVHVVKDSLEEIRKEIPMGFSRLPRSKDDDPVIVEVWV